MSKTKVSIIGEDFYINGRKTYCESPKSDVHGLLMNARFIQGIFDAQNGRERFNRYTRQFDPDKNTNDLIAQLPNWYRYGLRAFTVGLQGGASCFTIEDSREYVNNPFSEDGLSFDSEYAKRLDKLIRAADRLGMVVIVNFFYICQNPKWHRASRLSAMKIPRRLETWSHPYVCMHHGDTITTRQSRNRLQTGACAKVRICFLPIVCLWSLDCHTTIYQRMSNFICKGLSRIKPPMESAG